MIPDRLPEEYDDAPSDRGYRIAGWIVVVSIVAAFAIGAVAMLPRAPVACVNVEDGR